MGMDLVDLFLELETAFGIELTDDAPTEFDGTVGALVDWIHRQLPPTGPGRGEVSLRIRELIGHRFLGGRLPNEEDQLVRDLGLD